MNTKAALIAIALLVGSVFSASSFAQSGTITFTGSIVAPACTGSSSNAAGFDVSLDNCANSEVQVVRTSIVSNTTNGNQVATQTTNTNSAVVTVSYE